MIKKLSELAEKSSYINPELYNKYEVKRGLRDINGRGVLTGLTEIGEVHSYIIKDEEIVPEPGKLFYRGIDVEEIVNGFLEDSRHGFEEVIYLLLFGSLPNNEMLGNFNSLLSDLRTLPKSFVRDIILKAPSKDVMNMLSRSVLALYSYDDSADGLSIDNILRQSLELIARFPLLAVYSYQAYSHYHQGNSLYIHSPKREYSTAENILHMLRPNSNFTQIEARLLDLALVLHAEHGGGNNSTFTTHVVTSSGTDTYSAISAALGSLKGPRHGGANIKVVQMFDDVKANIKDWKNDDEVSNYLTKILNKEAFDKSGLIYGMGHAVYSVSDPRAEILRSHCKALAVDKGLEDEFDLYFRIEKLAKKVIAEERKIYKGVSANVDFYSGFVYKMLDLPQELLTPIFAIARISGWSAHRIEEIVNKGKIIRPAYKSISDRVEYVNLKNR
ncbi:citrate synthase [Alkalibaculum sp. M08DMB]|uniref:Citrate synthase n=1 Tax=Alkalibaculum sporogenes TaxID=2655001 RepID=A0A6A7KCP1_9FIRM|nr:citrate/2-methylcitrate synthase [Alkalibaculum sporogenes]MPW27122.1 citrate synthase [Alkalibaculum sporogenes]